MADPLSIIASIIAVVGAAESVGKTLNRIKDITNAPDEVLALTNEISDLTVVLKHVETYVTAVDSAATCPGNLEHLSVLAKRAQSRLAQLEQIMHNHLPETGGANKRSSLLRLQWALLKTKVDGLRADLRDIKLSILVQMTTVTGTQQSRIHVVVHEILLAINQLRDGQTSMRRETEPLSNNVFHHILQARSPTMRPMDGRHENHGDAQSRDRRWLQSKPRISDSQSPSVYNQDSRFPFLRVRAHVQRSLRSCCTASCKRSCHKPRRFRSPTPLDAFLGVLLVGYSCSTAMLSDRCSNHSCKRDAPFDARIQYTFPYWFLYNVCATLSIISTGDPALCLRITRARPGGPDVFRLVKINDIRGLQALFSAGKASPVDIYESGHSALSYAVRERRLEMSAFLLNAGANSHTKYGGQCSAYEVALDVIFTELVDFASVEFFKSLFFNEDCVEELEFSRFHQVVLGLLHRDLGEELRISRRPEINHVDSRGRSAVSWAALKGDSKAVSLLVEAGADVNISDSEGNTPLIYSVQGKYTSCMDILLKAGADAKPKNTGGRNALLYAMRTAANPLCIKPLLATGIDVNSRDVHGTSALALSVINGSSSCITTLLRYGAHIDSADNAGDTALIESLFYNNDDALKLLLASGADYTKIDSYGDPIPHKVAIYGGLRTIEIFHEANLRDLDIHATNKSGKTARELARSREGTPDGFVEAFDIMLASIEARTAKQTPQPVDFIYGEDLGRCDLGSDAESIDVFCDALETAEL